MEATGGTNLINPQQVLKNELGLQQGHIYADLGIGSAAHFIFPAAEIVGNDGKVYALDILKTALNAVNSRARVDGLMNIKTVWTDLEVYGAAKEIQNESLDRLSIVNLLFQTKQDEHVFNEANRMLKKGGKAVVIDWLPNGSSFGPALDKRTSLDEVRRLAQIVGWNEVHSFEPGQFHFGVVFEKPV